MEGILESLLSRLYGEPSVVRASPFDEWRWNETDEASRCILYKPLVWDAELETQYSVLRSVYGDAVGGFLVGSSLKAATLRGPEVWGLYRIADLWRQVADVIEQAPGICFFMDAANVWYYGLKEGRLWVFDAGTDELDDLGEFEAEMEVLLRDWESAKA